MSEAEASGPRPSQPGEEAAAAGAEVVCLGEALVDLYAEPAGRSVAEADMYRARLGGAPANVATAVARLGGRVQLVGRVGRDDFGRLLRSRLAAEGVDTSLLGDVDAATGLCFVSVHDGERRFSPYPRRFAAADKRWQVQPAELAAVARADVVYVGSTGLAAEPSRSSTEQALAHAAGGAAPGGTAPGRPLVLVDVNLRLHQWADRDEGILFARELARRADVVKLADDELAAVAGTNDPDAAAERLLADDPSPSLVAITLGARGASLHARGGLRLSVPGVPVAAVDPTGAGDVFSAVLGLALARLRARTGPLPLADLLAAAPGGWLAGVLALANAAAAHATTAFGATTALVRTGDLAGLPGLDARGGELARLVGLDGGLGQVGARSPDERDGGGTPAV